MKSEIELSEIKRRLGIREVWRALGGGRLIGGRGQAFWRDGAGYNVALDQKKGLWYDHARSEGGDAIDLVRRAEGSSFTGALRRLAELGGVKTPRRAANPWRAAQASWRADLDEALDWKAAAAAMAELELDQMPLYREWGEPRSDCDRGALTRLLRVIRLGEQSLVEEYRAWRTADPVFVYAMIQAGRRRNSRLQDQLAGLLQAESEKANGEN
jgi:hypothetical protein